MTPTLTSRFVLTAKPIGCCWKACHGKTLSEQGDVMPRDVLTFVSSGLTIWLLLRQDMKPSSSHVTHAYLPISTFRTLDVAPRGARRVTLNLLHQFIDLHSLRSMRNCICIRPHALLHEALPNSSQLPPLRGSDACCSSKTA